MVGGKGLLGLVEGVELADPGLAFPDDPWLAVVDAALPDIPEEGGRDAVLIGEAGVDAVAAGTGFRERVGRELDGLLPLVEVVEDALDDVALGVGHFGETVGGSERLGESNEWGHGVVCGSVACLSGLSSRMIRS